MRLHPSKLGEEIQLPTIINREVNELSKIEWTPNDDLSCSDCLNPVASPYESIAYQLNIVDFNK